MARSVKSKIAWATGTLFALLLAVSVVAFVFIQLLSSRTESLLTANYQTIRYCNEMMHELDNPMLDAEMLRRFEKALTAQEANITEPGEGAATQKLRVYFDLLKAGNRTPGIRDTMNAQLYRISLLNQHALERKNAQALKTSAMAKIWIALLAALVVLIGFTLTVNFPGYIANPIKLLTEAIHEIAQKNYHQRIRIDSRDEFGQMADAFNAMAHKLDEYESSNLSRILFEKKRVETVINQMEDAVLGLDASGKILFINHAAETLFHLSSDKIVGRYAPDVALYNDLLRTVLQKETQGPLKIIHEGKEHFFAADARKVENEGAPLGEVFTLSDITSFKELDISKTNLLATISHELKTPISSIKMSAKLMNDTRVGALNPEQQELMHSISGDAERLLRLTGELLNMTQLETGNIQLKLAPTDAVQMAGRALEAVRMLQQQQQIRPETVYPDMPVQVVADADKTEWVLINFLTNAIKYSAAGSSISLQITTTGTEVRFSVQDHGEGIAPEDFPKIFDRYYKAGQGHTGTGLGLSIAREFIEAQGGRISAESVPGKGSTFSFTLPAA